MENFLRENWSNVSQDSHLLKTEQLLLEPGDVGLLAGTRMLNSVKSDSGL